jgi:hypothetical protein
MTLNLSNIQLFRSPDPLPVSALLSHIRPGNLEYLTVTPVLIVISIVTWLK